MKKITLFLSIAVLCFCMVAEEAAFTMDFSYRKGFIRLEENPLLHININNPGRQDVSAELTLAYAGLNGLNPLKLKLTPGRNLVKARLETRFKPGSYPLKAVLSSAAGQLAAAETTITITAEQGDILPVMMWGGGNLSELKRLGFTHYLVMVNILLARNQTADAITNIDRALSENIYCFDRFSLATEKEFLEKFQRRDRNGKPYERPNLDASNPEAIEWTRKRAARVGEFLAEHPGFDGALINSEVRDGTQPSFTGFEEAEFRKATGGAEVPSQVKGSNGVPYFGLPGFPSSRIVPDNDPLLVYYQWFWKTGDGWNPLQGILSDTYHESIKRPFLTFFDPAVRVPPVWGSGGKVDAINHWTYTNPDPLRMGLAADEMIAMADGAPGQKIMKMTQLFWYRDRSAPVAMKVENPPSWIQEEPDAKYITISPDHLKIAFWNKIARRLDAILYHGSPSLLSKSKNAYRYTNPHTKEALAELSASVIKPLGPTLKRIPERQADVAILQSFTNAIFTQNNHSYGSAHAFTSDLHMALQWNHFQPAIIYDEHILRGDLAKYKVLFLPGAEVLTQSVFEAILEFQRGGGIVVADEKIVPGILPDISIKSVRRYTVAEPSKKVFQKLGQQIKQKLAPYYQSDFEASNQDLVVRTRRYKTADYLFVLNDKRAYGDYVGQYRRVLENGVPNAGTVTLRRKAGAIYDLVKHQAVDFQALPDRCEIPVSLDAGGGMILLVLDEPLAKIELNAPGTAKPGEPFSADIRITTADGNAPDALIPVEATLLNTQHEPVAGSGWHCAADGRVTVSFTPSLNDAAGEWRLNVRDLASGNTASALIQVK
jgi:hypothetical protein